MSNSISRYLNVFKARLKIDPAAKNSVVQELHTHLEEKSQELEESGLSKEEADNVAAQILGPPEMIAQQIYEVHAQGSWQEAFFAALPHFLVALLFASYYWASSICLLSVLMATVGITIYGWCRGKPVWLFPWLGYYMLPVVITGVLLMYLSRGWGWVAVLLYTPMALFVLVYVVKQTAMRDWLYASLMLAPMPVIFSWLLSLGTGGEFLTSDVGIAQLQTKMPWIVISFLVLAVATVAFVRLTQRWCKTIALLIPPIIILVSVAMASRGNIDLWGWLILFISLLAFTSPVWIQARIHHV